MPNEPPTLPVSTRIFSTGAFSGPISSWRMLNTPWQPSRSVQRSVSASYSPIAERGSIGQTTTRLLRIFSRVTWAALANAASTAAASP